MTTRGIAGIIFACAAAIMLAGSCKHPYARESSQDAGSSPKGSLSLRFSSGASGGSKSIARTVMPGLAADIASIRVTINDSSGHSRTGTTTLGGSLAFDDLVAGRWSVVATALSSTDGEIGAGSASATVLDGQTQTVSIAISPSAGVGTLNLSVRWPIATDIYGVSGSITTSTGDTIALGTLGLGSDSTYFFTQVYRSGLPSGTNTLRLDFTRGSTPAGSFVEAVNVFPGCESNQWIDSAGMSQYYWTIGTDDFLDASASLGGLAIDSSSGFAFAPNTYSYSGFQIDAEALSFTPTRYMAGQSISYSWNGGTNVPAASGTRVSGLAFIDGPNLLLITVTAPDGITARAYDILIMAYPVNYDANEATSGSPPASRILPSGRTISIAGVGSLQRDGIGCNGWYSNPSGVGGALYATSSSYTIVSAPLTLYALWTSTALANLNTGGSTWTLTGPLNDYDWAGLRTLLLAASTSKTLDLSGTTATTIPENAFQNCSYLASIALPANLSTIGIGAFYGCSRLMSIDIPDSVTSIGMFAFYECMSLASIDLPTSITSLDQYTFYGCSNLYSVVIPATVTSIGNVAFAWCANLSSITIPNSVISIGDAAFGPCTSLTSITIPASVTSIGGYCFQQDLNLTTMHIQAASTPALGDQIFLYLPTVPRIYVPNASLAAYRTAWPAYASNIYGE